MQGVPCSCRCRIQDCEAINIVKAAADFLQSSCGLGINDSYFLASCYEPREVYGCQKTINRLVVKFRNTHKLDHLSLGVKTTLSKKFNCLIDSRPLFKIESHRYTLNVYSNTSYQKHVRIGHRMGVSRFMPY